MKAVGMVKSVKGSSALLVVDPKTSCSSCALYGICSTSSGDEGLLENIFVRTNSIVVSNEIGAKPLEIVEFEYEESEINKAVFFVYGIPLIFIIIGVITGVFLEKILSIKLLSLENFTVVLTTLIFLFISIGLVKYLDAKRQKLFKITEILTIRK